MNLRAAGAFAAYVVWLLAFPMEGFLLGPRGDAHALLWFLVPHAAALALVAATRVPSRFLSWAAWSGLATAAVTAVFPFLPGHWHGVLAAAGACSAPLVVRVGTVLSGARAPRVSAVWGLVGGNLLLAGLGPLPLPAPYKYGLVAAGLAAASLVRIPEDRGGRAAGGAGGEVRSLGLYLPFILLFQLVSGLFYARLLPAYAAVQAVPGAELALYCVAALVALYVLRGSVDGALALGIPSSLVALVLFQAGFPFSVHLSMYAMQAAAGFMDAFLLFLLLGQPDAARAFATGLATMCAGIAGGQVLALVVGPDSGVFTAVGNAALNLALFSLYFAHRRPRPAAPGGDVPDAGTPWTATPGAAPRFQVPPALGARLSAMEREVLGHVLEGKTFREVAGETRISESSVKTYMKRIYGKAEARGKKDLLSKLSSSG